MCVVRYLKQHSSPIMTVMTSLMLVTMIFAPPYNYYTKWSFVTYWSIVRGENQRWLVTFALVVLLAGIALNNRLQKLEWRWLEWSAFSKKANVMYGPLQYKRLGWVYTAVLIFCMPLMALLEEVVFRYAAGKLGLVVLLIVSGPIFGIIHVSSGVTIRMATYLSLVGLVMAGLYLGTGLLGVFVFHASYNLIAIAFVIFELRVRKPLGELFSQHTVTRRQLPTVTAWLAKQDISAVN